MYAKALLVMMVFVTAITTMSFVEKVKNQYKEVLLLIYPDLKKINWSLSNEEIDLVFPTGFMGTYEFEYWTPTRALCLELSSTLGEEGVKDCEW